MIIYQVRIKIDREVHDKWLHWMKTKHVPDLIATGLISSYQIWENKYTDDLEYCFNYYFANEADLDAYQKGHAPKLKADTHAHFSDRFTASRYIYKQL